MLGFLESLAIEKKIVDHGSLQVPRGDLAQEAVRCGSVPAQSEVSTSFPADSGVYRLEDGVFALSIFDGLLTLLFLFLFTPLLLFHVIQSLGVSPRKQGGETLSPHPY